MDLTQICCSELELGQSQQAQDCTLELQDQTISSTSSQESLMETTSGKLKILPPNGLPGLVRMLEDASTTKRELLAQGLPCSPVWCLWGERGSPCAQLGFTGSMAVPAACASLPLCSCLPVVCADCYECHHLVCHVDIIIFS